MLISLKVSFRLFVESKNTICLFLDAQSDISQIDVLVCGSCHEVFHFIRDLENHKSDNCSKTSTLKCENEEKPQIWGFSLWKAKYIQKIKAKNEDVPSSWDIYQKWTSLDDSEKDLWLAAGKRLQYCKKIASSKIEEVKVKEEQDPLALETPEAEENDVSMEGKAARGSRSGNSKKEEYNVEKIVGKRFNTRKKYWEYEVKWENYAE